MSEELKQCRSSFEEWYGTHSESADKKRVSFFRREGYGYYLKHVDKAWELWQASYHRGQMDVVENIRKMLLNAGPIMFPQIGADDLINASYTDFMDELDRIEHEIKSHQQG